ncbi:MAG: MucB/RseB C-terminal domain-containing protein [Methylicorpusculum sp.]|uniref:MucB/RseB C-terminal domain-containing protein n=1 Tax=Methylicorpusculum sp. TaxID=2713644 RepID=UPI0027279490|nr:MucB/RseB C-terminal domain-containing protein [Methylicorpusculum sp.]MDO8845551.1 MucB/RseB C-terminal domain-containing protein [Methylicorpusculum sp.]MDO8938954.1 MucB/RseB C-terminal domain-containing protein [Methylicorpusculum sp.]MDP2200502.1 MucB/RseB C-terminal domain-containing protein [Methylicorpusculum sp.]
MLKLFSIILILAATNTFADELQPSPSQTLMKMQQAMDLLNYHGTVAFLRNGKLNTLKYSHASIEGQNQERLITLNSPMHEVIRDADKVSCFFESTSKVVVDHRPSARSFLMDLPERMDGVEEYYDLTFSGEEQVALLTARVLDIKPKDAFRYARRIWVEKQQFLPLKIEVYDQNNNTIEQVVFTEMTLEKSLPLVDVNASFSGREIQHIHDRMPMPFDQAGFELTQVPGGFAPQFYIQLNMSDADQPVEHLLLSDGFSSISVYLEQKNEKMELGASSSGTVNSFSRLVDNYLLTVMGEVPPSAVKLIAEGAKLRSD